jgi:hypothetical protein
LRGYGSQFCTFSLAILVAAGAWAQQPPGNAVDTEQMLRIKTVILSALNACVAPRFTDEAERKRRVALFHRNLGISVKEVGKRFDTIMSSADTAQGVNAARITCTKPVKRKAARRKAPKKAPENKASDQSKALEFLVDLACGHTRAAVGKSAFSALMTAKGLSDGTIESAIQSALASETIFRALLKRTDACLSESINRSANDRIEHRFVGQLGDDGSFRFRISGKSLVAAGARIRGHNLLLRSSSIENGSFILTGKSDANYIRLDGKLKSNGQWVRGSYSGTVDKKRVRGRFSAARR